MEAASIYYTSSELAIKQHNTNPYADQIMLISYKNFKYKTKESSTTGNFNYSYENLLGDAKGKRTHEYKDILQYGVEEGNHGVITNYEDFNGEPNYSPDADNDSNKYWLYTYDTTVMILEKLYSMYDEKNPNQQFNFVICDDDNHILNRLSSLFESAFMSSSKLARTVTAAAGLDIVKWVEALFSLSREADPLVTVQLTKR